MSVVVNEQPRCPKCDTIVEGRKPLDDYQNTELEPCGCIISVGELEERYLCSGGGSV